MPVTILVIPTTLLALKLALSFTLLALLLSSILILIPRILCLGRGAGHYANADEQQQSQDCPSKFLQSHDPNLPTLEVRNGHASAVNRLQYPWNRRIGLFPYSISCQRKRHGN